LSIIDLITVFDVIPANLQVDNVSDVALNAVCRPVVVSDIKDPDQYKPQMILNMDECTFKIVFEKKRATDKELTATVLVSKTATITS